MVLLPFVSICTPTFNRRPFLPYLALCIQMQTYPADRMEWVIVDDGSDCVRDAIESIRPQLKCTVKYFYCSEHKLLGNKRNWLHTQCSGDIFVNMDDDDYYPPTRVSHAVEQLVARPDCLIAGSDVMYMFYPHLAATTQHALFQCGPHINMTDGNANENYRATAATFAFRRELLSSTAFSADVALAEEPSFLRGYTIPMVQLDPLQTIFVISHAQNSLDKTVLLEMKDESALTPIYIPLETILPNKTPQEQAIYMFYLHSLHSNLLSAYPNGDASQKPWITTPANDALERFGKKKLDVQIQLVNELRSRIAMKDDLIQRLMRRIQSLPPQPRNKPT